MSDMNNSGSNSGEVIKLSEGLLHPRDYVAPSMDNLQTQGTKNVILKMGVSQIHNNAVQAKGSVAGPSVFGGAEGFDGEKSDAEAGTKGSTGYSVDLTDGQHNCWNGGMPKK